MVVLADKMKNPSVVMLNCGLCVDEMPPGHSPQMWGHVEAGLSPEGHLVVWCLRHDKLVARLSPEQAMEIVEGGCAQCGGH